MRADQAIVYIKNDYLKFDLVGLVWTDSMSKFKLLK